MGHIAKVVQRHVADGTVKHSYGRGVIIFENDRIGVASSLLTNMKNDDLILLPSFIMMIIYFDLLFV